MIPFRVLGQTAKILPNGFLWLPIHWSHDPDKTPDWALRQRALFPRPVDWDKEMEIDFGLHLGTPAYQRYSDAKHLGPTEYDPRRPLCVAFDFNVNPMSIIVGQDKPELRQIQVHKAIVYGPTTIDEAVLTFRRMYPAHQSDLLLYGDATKGANAQTAVSNWHMVQLAFRGYPVQPIMKVPDANPRIGNRLNAVNHLLQGAGERTLVINDDGSCEELVRDLREVILTPDGSKIYKSTDMEQPYFFRTHASDAFGYWIYFDWPTVAALYSEVKKKREPIQYGRLLGEVDQGPKWREEQRAREQQTKKKRPSLDRGNAL